MKTILIIYTVMQIALFVLRAFGIIKINWIVVFVPTQILIAVFFFLCWTLARAWH